ncbi:MAG: SLC13 family permease [Myxococcota bacterium]
MGHPAAFTLVVLVIVVGFLVFSAFGADTVLLGGLVALVLGGVLEPKAALAGFANEGMITVAALFVVAAGVRQTGAMSRMSALLLGRTKDTRVAIARLVFPVAGMSAFLNNTPIVAALLPAVVEWCRRNQQPASRYLIPLSYATILGGTITVVGTSTNLVVTGLIDKNLATHPGLHSIGILDISGIGLPVAIAGCLVLVAFVPWLLPDRRPAIATDDARTYTSEFIVAAGGPLVGKTIEAGGLRHLPGAFLAELDRGETVLPAVEPTTRLEADDRLVFVGPRETVVDLARIPGLVPAPTQIFKLDTPRADRCLVEAVVAPGNPLVGRTIRDGGFRSAFNAVVIAVARDGDRVGGKIGDIVLERGDVLLLETHPSWVEGQRTRRDFYLVSTVDDSSQFRHDRAPIALITITVMVILAATNLTSMLTAAVCAGVVLVATGCVSGDEARRSVDGPVLLAIACALGVGDAIHVSGADAMLATSVVGWGGGSAIASLIAMYVATTVLTELITNNAAAALMFPFALSLGDTLGVSPMPFCVAVMFAASASFSTPIGYQTNLMVFGPGGYRFADFFRIGIPLQIGVGIVTCALIPVFFPF